METTGYRYSSSIYPVKHDLYGEPNAPRFSHEPNGHGGILELPISTYRQFGRNFPAGGGGYFRFLPYPVTRAAINAINEREGQPAIFYLHPWEIDPKQPRMQNISFKSGFRHYLNLDKTEERLRRLLHDFSWGRLDEIFLVPHMVQQAAQ